MNSLELFSGAGGLALGIHLAGFRHLAVVERDHDSCNTLRANGSSSSGNGLSWPVMEADVAELDYSLLRQFGPVHLLAGGPPCQPFSLGGKHAGQSDRRNLFPQVFKAMRELRPQAVLIENVRGLVRESFKPYFQYILDQMALPELPALPNETWRDHAERLAGAQLRKGQYPSASCYDVWWQLYNVADFGIPQERFRVFFVAFRRDLGITWQFPYPLHSREALLYSLLVDHSYWEEHGLAPQPVPSYLSVQVSRLKASPRPLFSRWRTVRDAIGDLPDPKDQSSHYDDHLFIPDARSYPGHTGSPWCWPAKTIKAGDHGNPGGENMLRHQDGSVRYFTVRELARLQTFPDWWRFPSSWSESRRQLGNAVPVDMAKTLATLIHEKLTICQRRVRQVWNNETKICYGFGKHGDDPLTRSNTRSPWDTLHPGRKWASTEGNKPYHLSPEEIAASITEHLRKNPPATSN
ncbi:MAG TPA: DNA cytosine methyltransferase [Chloroflexota bacterium]|nr:DNA cytosine methyltransferase [Chloroflexota bacterium]